MLLPYVGIRAPDSGKSNSTFSKYSSSELIYSMTKSGERVSSSRYSVNFLIFVSLAEKIIFFFYSYLLRRSSITADIGIPFP